MQTILPCAFCLGSGWVPVEDPTLDGLVDVRCPDCPFVTEQSAPS